MSLLNGITWQSAGMTNVGKVRKINEDAYLERPEAGLWVVADGMGGHDAGDLASSAIVDRLASIVPPQEMTRYVDVIRDNLQSVNQALFQEARERGGHTTIGSTVVALLAIEGRCACLWAGDSRAYRLRDGVLESISRDHSEVQELVEQGLISKDAAEDHPSANVITRAVGAVEPLVVDVKINEIKAGDRYLLCSDGLYKEVSEREIAQHMQFGKDSAAVTHSLLETALSRGARDNVSVVTIEFSQPVQGY